MTTDSPRAAEWLLEQLEDPFTLFPLESVADNLFEATVQAERRKTEDMGWWGVSRKYWSAKEEHYHDMQGLLVGAMFVLGQAAIVQSVSILTELSKYPLSHGVIPESKPEKLAAHGAVDSETQLGKIVIINAVSNYFKHAYEWPAQWDTTPTNGKQGETIDVVRRIGMTPRELADNMLLAADRLGLRRSNRRALTTIIRDWRENWARVLYHSFGLRDPHNS